MRPRKHQRHTLHVVLIVLLSLAAAACASGEGAVEAATAEAAETADSESPGDTSAAEVATTPDADAVAGRLTDGVLTLYEFDEGSGDQVADSAAGYDLTVADPAAVEWTNGGLRLRESTTLANPGTPAALIDAVVASGEITVEAWIETNDLEQNGPARIVSISGDTQNRNLTLGQGVHGGTGNFMDFRLRTTDTDDNGTPSLASPDGVLRTDLTHLVASRSADGTTRLYFDGALESTGTAAGDLSNWDSSYRLLLGNEATGDRPWIGTLHLVAVYDHALSDADVAANFSAGP